MQGTSCGDCQAIITAGRFDKKGKQERKWEALLCVPGALKNHTCIRKSFTETNLYSTIIFSVSQ